MSEIVKPQGSTHTEALELQAEKVIGNQTEISAEIPSPAPQHERFLSIGTPYSSTAASATERIEEEQLTRPAKEVHQDEDSKKNERARANALMDVECLRYLRLFSMKKTLGVDELNRSMEHNKDWLKIALLVRADYLETLDSTVRITPEGLAAWRALNQLKKLSGSGV